MSVPSLRALTERDGASALALVRSVYDPTRHLARTMELVELALPGNDSECLGLVSIDADGSLRALVLYGRIGGAAGVVKVSALVGRTAQALTDLLSGLRALDSVRNARMFVCELSDESVDGLAVRALTSAGFKREAAIADYFADGITLDVLVLRR